VGGGGVEELAESSVVAVDLGVEQLDSLGQRSHGGAGGLLVDGAARTVTELGARRDPASGAQPTQLRSQRFIGGDDQRFQFVDRGGADAHRPGPGHGTDADRFADPIMGTRDAQTLAASISRAARTASTASDLAPSLVLRVGRSNSITHSPRRPSATARPRP
jgi:hypothetical protein